MESLIKTNQKLPGSIPRAIHERFVDENKKTNKTRRTMKDLGGRTVGHMGQPVDRQKMTEKTDGQGTEDSDDVKLKSEMTYSELEKISSADLKIDSQKKSKVLDMELMELNDPEREEVLNSGAESVRTGLTFEDLEDDIWSIATETEDVETVVADDSSNDGNNDGSESDTSGIFSLDLSDNEQRNFWN